MGYFFSVRYSGLVDGGLSGQHSTFQHIGHFRIQSANGPKTFLNWEWKIFKNSMIMLFKFSKVMTTMELSTYAVLWHMLNKEWLLSVHYFLWVSISTSPSSHPAHFHVWCKSHYFTLKCYQHIPWILSSCVYCVCPQFLSIQHPSNMKNEILAQHA